VIWRVDFGGPGIVGDEGGSRPGLEHKKIYIAVCAS
jgi:hypothetical protein